MLMEAVSQAGDCVVGGSLISWGVEWQTMFDLVVFLYVPREIRMKRLVERELERYGQIIYTDSQRNRLFTEFYDWASKYDDEIFTGRNRRIQEDWLGGVSCKTIKIHGDTTVEERLQVILASGL